MPTLPLAGCLCFITCVFRSLLGRRKAKEYSAKRDQPWPPIVFDRLIQALNEK